MSSVSTAEGAMRLKWALSFVHINVHVRPNAEIAAHTNITPSRPAARRMGGRRAPPSTAPSLPAAALMPCAVARTLVGKDSEGMTNVVTFGPQLQKKNVEP